MKERETKRKHSNIDGRCRRRSWSRRFDWLTTHFLAVVKFFFCCCFGFFFFKMTFDVIDQYHGNVASSCIDGSFLERRWTCHWCRIAFQIDVATIVDFRGNPNYGRFHYPKSSRGEQKKNAISSAQEVTSSPATRSREQRTKPFFFYFILLLLLLLLLFLFFFCLLLSATAIDTRLSLETWYNKSLVTQSLPFSR